MGALSSRPHWMLLRRVLSCHMRACGFAARPPHASRRRGGEGRSGGKRTEENGKDSDRRKNARRDHLQARARSLRSSF